MSTLEKRSRYVGLWDFVVGPNESAADAKLGIIGARDIGKCLNQHCSDTKKRAMPLATTLHPST